MTSIMTIYKGGDEDHVGNYRGITLLHTGSEPLANIMAGFRRKRDTTDHSFVLLIGNRLKNEGRRLHVGFIFKTAFDIVARDILIGKVKRLTRGAPDLWRTDLDQTLRIVF